MLESDQRGQKQTACHVLVASSEDNLKAEKGDLWDSGKIASDQSALVAYAGKPLLSHQPCFWKVRVWDKDGRPSAWSDPASWTMGILTPQDWQGAKWIAATTKPVIPPGAEASDGLGYHADDLAEGGGDQAGPGGPRCLEAD